MYYISIGKQSLKITMILLATQDRVLSLPKRSGFNWKEELIRARSLSRDRPLFLEQVVPL